MPLYRYSNLELMPGPGGDQIEIERYAIQLDEAASGIETINAVLFTKIQNFGARIQAAADSQP